MAFHREARERLEELEGLDALASRLGQQRAACLAELRSAAEELGRARRQQAPPFGRAVEAQLRLLAMPHARFEVKVGGDVPDDDLRALSGEDVTFLLGANPGEPLLPLQSGVGRRVGPGHAGPPVAATGRPAPRRRPRHARL